MPASPSTGATAASVPLVTWTRSFPATPGQVPQARRFLAALLEGLPDADDVLLCLTELATNSVLHSRSARPGGEFSVRVSREPGLLTVEVSDEGGHWAVRSPGDEHGRGLGIVRALATDLHISDVGRDAPIRTATFTMSLG